MQKHNAKRFDLQLYWLVRALRLVHSHIGYRSSEKQIAASLLATSCVQGEKVNDNKYLIHCFGKPIHDIVVAFLKCSKPSRGRRLLSLLTLFPFTLQSNRATAGTSDIVGWAAVDEDATGVVVHYHCESSAHCAGTPVQRLALVLCQIWVGVRGLARGIQSCPAPDDGRMR
jgi:hypothetical protein